MDNKDEVGKSNARKSGSNSNKPGLLSVRNDAMARLDERISSKKSNPSVTSAPGTHAVSGAAASRLDERIASKQEQGSERKATRQQLSDLEADVVAKTKGRGGFADSSLGSQIVSNNQASCLLDASIAAKTATGAYTVGWEEASRLDARIAAKGRVYTAHQQDPESSGRQSLFRPSISRVHGTARYELNQLEEEVSAKARANGGRHSLDAKPRAREALNERV